jgi:hypothetical protein
MGRSRCWWWIEWRGLRRIEPEPPERTAAAKIGGPTHLTRAALNRIMAPGLAGHSKSAERRALREHAALPKYQYLCHGSGKHRDGLRKPLFQIGAQADRAPIAFRDVYWDRGVKPADRYQVARVGDGICRKRFDARLDDAGDFGFDGIPIAELAEVLDDRFLTHKKTLSNVSTGAVGVEVGNDEWADQRGRTGSDMLMA